MDNDIKLIWNELWKIYKEFLVDHDVKEYTRKASELVHRFDGNAKAQQFCQNIIISWVPVINEMAAEYREGQNENNI